MIYVILYSVLSGYDNLTSKCMKKELKRPFLGGGGVSLISYFSTDKILGTEYGIHLSCAMIADHVTLLAILSALLDSLDQCSLTLFLHI